MQYRVRAILPDGRAALIKPDADDMFSAVAEAGRRLRSDGHSLASFKVVTVKPSTVQKSGIFIGKAREKKPKKATAPVAATTAPAPSPAPTLAAGGKSVPAATSGNKNK